MVLAMYVGMLGLGAVFAAILFAFGTTPQDARYDLPVFFAFVMCFNMTVPMAFWMRHRGHPQNRIAEMVGAMVLPAVVAVILFGLDIVGAGAVCPIECTAMLGTMLAVMLIRAPEYSGPLNSAPTGNG